jgi:hypothetical protein
MKEELKNSVLKYIRKLDDEDANEENKDVVYCSARHGVRYFFIKYGNGINNIPLELPCNNRVKIPGNYCADHMRRAAYAEEKVQHYWFYHFNNGSIHGDYTVECRMMGSEYYNAHVGLWGAPSDEDLKIAQLCKDKTMSRAKQIQDKSKQLKLADMGFKCEIPAPNPPLKTKPKRPPQPTQKSEQKSTIEYAVYMPKGPVKHKESDCAPCAVESIIRVHLKALPDRDGYYAGDNGGIYSKDPESGHYRKLTDEEINELE